MTDSVRVTGGGNPVYFNWALPGQIPNFTTTVTGYSAPMPKDGVYCSFQASVRGTSGTQTATAVIQVTNEPHAAGADNVITGERNNFPINTTNGSATITSPEGLFRVNMDQDEVYAIGVPAGATMTYVSPTSATLSVNATATATAVQARFQDTRLWASTALTTITLSGTLGSSDAQATQVAYKWVRVHLTAITGTGAKFQANELS